jgi:prepilin-type N-terminal cleavage/methylation domain-containing protein
LRGFTLLEVLMTLSVSFILLMLVNVGWSHLLQQEQDRYLLRLIARSLTVAQQTALAQSIKIAWTYTNTELLVFADTDNSGELSDANTLFRQERVNWHGGQLHVRAYPHYRAYLQFAPDLKQQADNATVWYCRQATARWALIINKWGHLLERLPDGQGQLTDSRGAKLRCEPS